MKSQKVSETESASETTSTSADLDEVRSIGDYLASQRRLRGISLEELATQTRIPLRSLERLEAGVFDREIDGFVRGFVRTVAEALGLDSADTLARTLAEPGADEVSGRYPRPQVRNLVLAAGLLAGLAATVAAVTALPIGSILARSSADTTELVLRRDPVRALAEARHAPPAPVTSAGEGRRRDP